MHRPLNMAPITLALIMFLFVNIRSNFVVCSPPWIGVLCAILDVMALIIIHYSLSCPGGLRLGNQCSLLTTLTDLLSVRLDSNTLHTGSSLRSRFDRASLDTLHLIHRIRYPCTIWNKNFELFVLISFPKENHGSLMHPDFLNGRQDVECPQAGSGRSWSQHSRSL